jgi:hypothetical protein
MRLIEFTRSPRSDKRFLARFMEPERTVYFGSPQQSTYIDHGNISIRNMHLMRYKKEWGINEDTFTIGILWGPTPSIEGNLSRLLLMFNIQDDR